MLQNAYFLAKIGADTAENEQHFADVARFRITGWPRTRASAARRGGPARPRRPPPAPRPGPRQRCATLRGAAERELQEGAKLAKLANFANF